MLCQAKNTDLHMTKVGIESPGIVRHRKKNLEVLEEEDDRDEQEKDIWTLKNF